MTDQSNDNHNPAESCESSDSCCGTGPADSGGCCCGGGLKGWKNLVFLLILLLAGMVAAHAIMGREDAPASEAPLALPVNDAVGSDQTAGGGGAVLAAASDKPAVGKAMCGVAAKSFPEVFAAADAKKANVVFVVLADDTDEVSRGAAGAVDGAIAKLSARGKAVAGFTLTHDAERYQELMKRLSIDSLPAVVVLGKGGAAQVVSDDFTEAKLLAAFVKASSPASCGVTCSPQSCAP